jgi:hypothetical protein
MVSGAARNWISVHTINNPAETKDESNKNDNSTSKKFKQPLAPATQ